MTYRAPMSVNEIYLEYEKRFRHAQRLIAEIAETHPISCRTDVKTTFRDGIRRSVAQGRVDFRIVIEGSVDVHHALKHDVIGPLLRAHAPITTLIYSKSKLHTAGLWDFRAYRDAPLRLLYSPASPQSGSLITNNVMSHLPTFANGTFEWYDPTRSFRAPKKQHPLGQKLYQRLSLEHEQLRKHATPALRRILQPIANTMHERARTAFENSSAHLTLG
jgi:hypothetical protein